jgi:hypothetical protein
MTFPNSSQVAPPSVDQARVGGMTRSEFERWKKGVAATEATTSRTPPKSSERKESIDQTRLDRMLEKVLSLGQRRSSSSDSAEASKNDLIMLRQKRERELASLQRQLKEEAMSADQRAVVRVPRHSDGCSMRKVSSGRSSIFCKSSLMTSLRTSDGSAT